MSDVFELHKWKAWSSMPPKMNYGYVETDEDGELLNRRRAFAAGCCRRVGCGGRLLQTSPFCLHLG